jgi:transcriptional regulator with XRE-family HTH domain
MQAQTTPRTSKLKPRFPNRIREYRVRAGITQEQLGKLIGRGRDAVSAWERGLNLPSIPKLMRMAKVLGTLSESLYMDFYSPSQDRDNQPAQ